jgi:hypothetical protein
VVNRVRVVDVRSHRKLRTRDQRAAIVYVAGEAPGWLGHKLANPFNPNSRWFGSLGECFIAYRDWLNLRPTFEADLAELWEATGYGAKALGCWCVNWQGTGEPPMVCHAVVLAALLNERFGES